MRLIKLIIGILALSLSSPTESQSQEFHAGIIMLNDSTILEGYIRPFFFDETNIHYKENLEAKKIKFKSRDLATISFTNEEDTMVFYRYYMGRYKQGGAKLKRYENTYWANKIYETDAIEAFQFAVRKQKIGINLLLEFFNTSGIFINFYERKMNFGVRFPEIDEIIDVAGVNGTNGLDNARYRRRLKNYLIRHCLAFRRIVKKDNSDSIRDLKEYLDYYSEICEG